LRIPPIIRSEDEPKEDIDDNDDEPLDPIIDALFDEVESLRMQVSLIRSGDAATLAYIIVPSYLMRK
jgi:hypothetical protein